MYTYAKTNTIHINRMIMAVSDITTSILPLNSVMNDHKDCNVGEQVKALDKLLNKSFRLSAATFIGTQK